MAPQKRTDNGRDQKGRFAKGNRANPGGRPKADPEVRKILDAASPQAAQKLVDLMKDEQSSPDIQLKAAANILDRTIGKPKTADDDNVDDKLLAFFQAMAGATQ